MAFIYEALVELVPLDRLRPYSLYDRTVTDLRLPHETRDHSHLCSRSRADVRCRSSSDEAGRRYGYGERQAAGPTVEVGQRNVRWKDHQGGGSCQ